MNKKLAFTTALLISFVIHNVANAWFFGDSPDRYAFIAKIGTIRNTDFSTKDVMTLVGISETCTLTTKSKGYDILRKVVDYKGKPIKIGYLPRHSDFKEWSRKSKIGLINAIDDNCRSAYYPSQNTTIPSNTLRNK